METENFNEKFLARFWNKVVKTDTCWLWNACVDKGGYGLILLHEKQLLKSHRVSWIIHRGPIPDGLHVLHNCPGGDNPSCINPEHLWLGTNLDNVRDKMSKGRHSMGDRTKSTGELSHFSKLTTEQVIQIRNLYSTGGLTYRDLSSRFGVCFQVIGAIVKRKTWKHVA